jgi:hypothetical protein
LKAFFNEFAKGGQIFSLQLLGGHWCPSGRGSGEVCPCSQSLFCLGYIEVGVWDWERLWGNRSRLKITPLVNGGYAGSVHNVIHSPYLNKAFNVHMMHITLDTLWSLNGQCRITRMYTLKGK